MSIKRSLKYLFLLSLSAGVMQNSLAQQSTPASIQKGIGNIFSNSDENELLEPEQAFKSKLTAKAPETLVVDLVPAKGYYLYKDKIRFALSDTKGVLIRKVMLPKGEIKMDATFGKMEVYRYPIQAIITLDRMATTKTVTVVTSYQGCHEKTGVCYPPVVTSASVALPGS
jgi:thiol:disulfide interchange protein